MENSSAVFPRNFRKALPIAVRGDGCWIDTADGRRMLDASGQAAVVSIGHGVAEIGLAMAEQAIAFAHTSQFHRRLPKSLRRDCWLWLLLIFTTVGEFILLRGIGGDRDGH
jgi:4-aminobutyrate aminotransferase-like enzyme